MSHIIAQNIVVEFPLFDSIARQVTTTPQNSVTGGSISPGPDGNGLVVKAIDDVSFTIKEGDRVALKGHNGSGKTTLLRALAGAYEPVSGFLEVQGRIASLLNISIGIDGNATGYENIFLRGIIMGMTPREIQKKMDEIADFTELGEYLNMPMRTYSSGMKLRLSFAVSTSVEADILIMDEWLNVGDKGFKEKAFQRLSKLVDNTSILVIASHSEELVSKLCNRSILLEHGKMSGSFLPRKPEKSAEKAG